MTKPISKRPKPQPGNLKSKIQKEKGILQRGSIIYDRLRIISRSVDECIREVINQLLKVNELIFVSEMDHLYFSYDNPSIVCVRLGINEKDV
ncbi:unnamed protein product [Dovyalis caffra]|uniref:Uncharacterized protein n=1 Tax=Dovyalis caffra TaxID=77055 RepID=A0AAV1SQM1_9ROSI|nr:unnamed protein product [Dovyalis caffra]